MSRILWVRSLMSQRTKNPILIVGQGLAGTILADKLMQAGQDIRVMDDGHCSSSSMAAAGLYNPFILKRRKLSWHADTFWRSSRDYFSSLDMKTQVDFPIGVLRKVHDVAEYNDWSILQDNTRVGPLLGPHLNQEDVTEQLEAPLGYRSVPSAGYVNVGSYLHQMRQRFIDKGKYIHEKFEEQKVELGTSLIYTGESYSHIVICTGYRSSSSSRFFPDLPFNPAKGHTLIVHCPGLNIETILSGPCFIIPQGEDKYIIGSTYSWHQLDEEIEPKEVDKLCELFRAMCELPFEIIESKAGVRPATKDRKPLIGSSTVHRMVFLFGGMGSRAVLCVPYLAQHLIEHLIEGKKMWPEVCLSRLAS